MHGSTRSYQTQAGERWEYSIELPPLPGKPRRQSRKRGFLSQDDAIAAMQAELTDRRRGLFIEPAKTTLGDYYADWLSITAPGRSGNSNRQYASVGKRLAPIAHIPIGRLQPQHIQQLVNGLAARYAPSTARHTYTVLASALKQAVAWGHLARTPAIGISLPRLPSRREQAAKTWSAAEVAHFLAATADSPWHPCWRVLIDAQLRAGELLALRWSDLDLDAAVITVARTLTVGPDHKIVIGQTAKSPSSHRPVTINPETVAALRRHRAAQLERRLADARWHDADLVFPGGHGKRLNPGVLNLALTTAIAAAGLPRLTPHGLRHTGATLMILAGVPLVVVSRRLGHATIAITADVYAHVSQDADRDAADALRRAISG